MNRQNNNSNGKVKSKFFNQDLFDDANVNEVGTSTSGQVISWGVGGNRNADKKVSDFNLLDSTQMFNFVNTEVTEFDENNSYSNNINNNVGQDVNAGLFNSQQFANSMNGQVIFDGGVNNQQTEYTTNVNDVVASVRIDSSISANPLSNEFVQDTPVFFGYNANPEVIAQNNNDASSSNQMMPYQPVEMEQNYINEQAAMNHEQLVQENTIVAPVFDPFNSMAEPAQTYIQESPVPMTPVEANSDLQLQQSSPLFAMAVESQNENTTSFDLENQSLNIDSSLGGIDDNTRINQPLSLMALSGEMIDEEQRPKEVIENSKYFQKTPLEDNRLKVEEIVTTPAVPVVDIIAEPTRDVNIKELVKSFVGEKYTKISMSPFSFCGAFFSSLYFFYRKMYLYGFIIAVINFIITFIMMKSWIIGLGLSLGLFIVVGLMTNNIYLSFVEKKVTEITIFYPKMSQYELQKICQQKGGTSLLLAFLLNIVVNAISSFLVSLFAGVSTITGLLNGGYNTAITNKNVLVDEIVEYSLPSEFVLVKGNEAGDTPYHLMETVKIKGVETKITSCGFNITVAKTDDNAKDFIQQMADADQRYNRTSTYQTVSGERWHVYSYEGADYFYIYRARKFNDEMLLITYKIHEDSTEGICELHLESIMNSIKEK